MGGCIRGSHLSRQAAFQASVALCDPSIGFGPAVEVGGDDHLCCVTQCC